MASVILLLADFDGVVAGSFNTRQPHIQLRSDCIATSAMRRPSS